MTHTSLHPLVTAPQVTTWSLPGGDSDFLSTHLSHLVPRQLNFICAKHFLRNRVPRAMEQGKDSGDGGRGDNEGTCCRPWSSQTSHPIVPIPASPLSTSPISRHRGLKTTRVQSRQPRAGCPATHCQDVCTPKVGPGWGPSQALPRNGRMMRGWWSSNGDIMRGTAPPVLLSSQGT